MVLAVFLNVVELPLLEGDQEFKKSLEVAKIK